MIPSLLFITIVLFFSPSFVDSASVSVLAQGPAVYDCDDTNQHDCYAVNIGPMNQSAANDACRKEGGELASIHSEKDQAFILSLKLVYYPSGLQLYRCYWTDGTPFDYGECEIHSGKGPWAIKAGDPAEPNYFGKDIIETCAYIHPKTKDWKEGWVDHPCNEKIWDGEKLGYICKRAAKLP